MGLTPFPPQGEARVARSRPAAARGAGVPSGMGPRLSYLPPGGPSPGAAQPALRFSSEESLHT